MPGDPAGLSHCVMTRFARPPADANRHGAGRPAALDTLSAPVFRLGLRGVSRGCHQPLQLGFHQIAQGSVLFAGQFLKLFSKNRVDAHVERYSFHCRHHAVVLGLQHGNTTQSL